MWLFATSHPFLHCYPRVIMDLDIALLILDRPSFVWILTGDLPELAERNNHVCLVLAMQFGSI